MADILREPVAILRAARFDERSIGEEEGLLVLSPPRASQRTHDVEAAPYFVSDVGGMLGKGEVGIKGDTQDLWVSFERQRRAPHGQAEVLSGLV